MRTLTRIETAPREHHKPKTIEELTARNDLELFDLRNDPGEMRNLARGDALPTEHLATLNAKLNALIDAEVGPDDGRDLPGPAFYWRG